MKIARLSSLVLALCPLWASAQSSVTVYGRVDLSLDRSKTGPTSLTQERDNASRLGFRGTEELGSGMKAVFGLEMGLNADTGASTSPMFRNSYVGLTGGFGSVAMGRLDSANPTGSPIYSLVTSNIDFVIHDAGAPGIGSFILSRNRVSNALGYKSPDFGGVTVMARYYLNGEGLPESPAGPVRAESDVKQWDVGVGYKAGGLGLGVGFSDNSKRGGLLNNDFDKQGILLASYDFGAAKAYGVWGRTEYKNTATTRDDVDFWLVGGSLEVGSGKIIANYLERDVQTDKRGTMKKAQAGYGHKLSKRTTVYGLYDQTDPNSNVSNNTTKTFSFGIQHNF